MDVVLLALTVDVAGEGAEGTTSKPIGEPATSRWVVAWYRKSL
jgi:hypothetical protein